MSVNKSLFASFLVFALMLISILIASFMFDGYRITWPHYAAFVTSMGWYGSELNKEMNRNE